MNHQTFVRRNRMNWNLSQEELAKLLGISQSAASRLEMGELDPDLSVALGLQVIFSRSPRALFPGLYRNIEEAVMRGAAAFSLDLEGKHDGASERKRQLLASMILRSGNAPETL